MRKRANHRLTKKPVVRHAAARAVEPLEGRLLMANNPVTLNNTLVAPNFENYEDSGAYHSGSSYFALAGKAQGSLYQAFGALDFVGVASGQTIADVKTLTLSLYNTAGVGSSGYDAVAGSFNVYLATDTASALTTNNAFDTSGSGEGPNNDGTNSTNSFGAGVSTQLIGNAAFSGAVGFDAMTFTPSATMDQLITNALNASGSKVRLVVAPVGTTAADFDGVYKTDTATLAITGDSAPAVSESYSIGAAAATNGVTVNETSGQVLVDVTRSGYTGDATTLNYKTTAGTAVDGTNYTGTQTGSVSFAANQSSAEISVPINNTSMMGNGTFAITLTSDTPTALNDTATIASPAATTVTIVGSGGLTNNVSNVPVSSSADVEAKGPYAGAGFLPVNATSAGNSGYTAFSTVEFAPGTSPSVFPPSGGQVTSLSNLSLTMVDDGYATATSTGGDLDVFFLASNETTAPTADLEFSSAAVDGINGQAGAILLGTFSDPNGGSGASYTFTPANLTTTVSNDIIADLNSGTAFRFAFGPGSGNFYGEFTTAGAALSLTDSVTISQTQENITFDNSNVTSIGENAGVATLTVDRSGSNLGDTETVSYSTSDDSALAGTNYVATAGTLTFGPNVTTQQITVPITAANPQGGDKVFTVTLSSPAVTGSSTVPILGSGTVTVSALSTNVTIQDASTAPVETLSGSVTDAADVEAAGPYDDSELKATTVYAHYASYGAADFMLNAAPQSTVTAIDSVTLGVTNKLTGTAGEIGVYLVSDNSSNILPSDPQSANPHFYDVTAGPQGFGTQFGTVMLLGSYNMTDVTAGDSVSIPLVNFTPATETALIGYLNSNTQFRLIVAAMDNNVYTDFDATPTVSIVAQEGVVSTQPTWLGTGSQATFNSASHVLTVTGPTSIVSNPGTDAPVIVGTASGDAVTIAPNSSGTVFDLGGFNLSGGATAAFNTGTSGLIATVAASGPFSITGTSTLDIGGNFLSLSGAGATGLATVSSDIASGNVISSLLGSADASHLHAIGSALGSIVSPAVPTIDGQSVGATDVVVRYTYFGDANLDGRVDGSDYTLVDGGYMANKTSPGSMSGWSNGDFNYDNSVNGSDYTLIDNAFNTQGASIPTPAAQVAKVFSAVPITAQSTGSIASSDLIGNDKRDSLAGIVDSVSETGSN